MHHMSTHTLSKYAVHITRDRGPKWHQRWHWAITTKPGTRDSIPVRSGWALTEARARHACTHAITCHSQVA